MWVGFFFCSSQMSKVSACYRKTPPDLLLFTVLFKLLKSHKSQKVHKCFIKQGLSLVNPSFLSCVQPCVSLIVDPTAPPVTWACWFHLRAPAHGGNKFRASARRQDKVGQGHMWRLHGVGVAVRWENEYSSFFPAISVWKTMRQEQLWVCF